ncbi:hypothetical protein C1N83_26640 [Priestia aryabhattai]
MAQGDIKESYLKLEEFEQEVAGYILEREEYEDWAKMSDNGYIGEQRTRKILSKEYWLLNRSIDANGADTILQRKSFKQDLLSIDPLRLGFAQSKFTENINRTISIDAKYIVDVDEQNNNKLVPLHGFFVFIHFNFSGSDTMEGVLFLTAEEILEFIQKEMKTASKIYVEHLKFEEKNQTGEVESEKTPEELARKKVEDKLQLPSRTLAKDRALKKIQIQINPAKLIEQKVGCTTEVDILDKIKENLNHTDYLGVSKRVLLGNKPKLEIVNNKIPELYRDTDVSEAMYQVHNISYELLSDAYDYLFHLKDLLRQVDPELFISSEDVKNSGDSQVELAQISLNKIRNSSYEQKLVKLGDSIQELVDKTNEVLPKATSSEDIGTNPKGETENRLGDLLDQLENEEISTAEMFACLANELQDFDSETVERYMDDISSAIKKKLIDE